MKSIKTKIILWMGLCLLVLVTAVVGYSAFSVRSMATANAKQSTLNLARGESGHIKAEIEGALDAARTLAQILSGVKAEDSEVELGRDEVNSLLNTVLAANPQFVGVYTCWEPDAFDGMDRGFRNDEGHDETGRFIPYWCRDEEGELILKPLIGYETEGDGDYYTRPRNAENECIIDPYVYPVAGKDTLITSLVVPIIAEGEFLGIAGVDLRLDFLQELADEIDIYGKTGSMCLISNNGTLAGATDQADLIGKALSTIDGESWQEDLVAIQNAEEGIHLRNGDIDVFAPIQFGQTTTPWSVKIAVPRAKVLAEANSLTWQLVGIGTACGFGALIVLWFMSGAIVRPIRILNDYMNCYSQGKLDPIKAHEAYVARSLSGRKDELGMLNTAMQRIKSYLLDNATITRQIAEGNLSVDVQLASTEDVFGIAFKQMVSNLREIVGRVRDSAQQVSEGAEQLDSASQSVNEGASTQAALVEEISSNMSELGEQTIENADNAKKADDLATKATSAAGQGQEQMNRMVDAMGEITKNATEIKTVIKVIDDIAFQTNLLALNAAVEAARAGQHGKGFAVVAEEVRNLAARSAKAASETAELIAGSQTNVKDGSEIADGTAETLSQIGGNVQETTTLVGSIANASQMQANQVSQINQQLRQIDDLTQKNAAAAEETASASTSMNAQAVALRQLLGHFRLNDLQQDKMAATSASESAVAHQAPVSQEPQYAEEGCFV